MGSVAIVLLLWAAGIAIGRTAGRPIAAHYVLAALAVFLVSALFLLFVSGW